MIYEERRIYLHLQLQFNDRPPDANPTIQEFPKPPQYGKTNNFKVQGDNKIKSEHNNTPARRKLDKNGTDTATLIKYNREYFNKFMRARRCLKQILCLQRQALNFNIITLRF